MKPSTMKTPMGKKTRKMTSVKRTMRGMKKTLMKREILSAPIARNAHPRYWRWRVLANCNPDYCLTYERRKLSIIEMNLRFRSQ